MRCCVTLPSSSALSSAQPGSRSCLQSGERQVPNARLAVVSGYGMVEYRYGMCANAVVLEAVERGVQ